MGERVQIVGRGGRSYLLVDDVLMPAIGGGEMLMEEADAGPDFSIFFPSGSSDDDSALFELNQSIVGGSDIFTNPATATSTSDRLRSDADLREVSANADGTLTMADGRVLTQASNPGLWDKLTKALGGAADLILNPRVLGALAAGGASLLASQLAAGDTPTLRLPDLASGQNPVLNQGSAIASAALSDPRTAAALQSAIQATIAGNAELANYYYAEAQRLSTESAATAPQNAAVRNLALGAVPSYMATGAEGQGYTALNADLQAEISRRLLPVVGPGSEALLERVKNWNDTYGPNQLTREAYLASTDPTAPKAKTVTDPMLVPMQQKALQTLAAGADAFRVDDPVGAAERARLLRAINGEEIDPTLEAKVAEGREALLNKLTQMYGRAGQEAEGTVGGYLTQQYDTEANKLRYAVNKDIIGTLDPAERARMQFAVNNPQNQYLAALGFYVPTAANLQAANTNQNLSLGADYRAQTAQLMAAQQAAQNARSTGLATNASLTGFGQRSLNDLATGLNSVMTIPPLLNLNDAGQRATVDTLRTNAATANFNAQNANRTSLSNAIGNLGGRVADSLLNPKQNISFNLGAGVSGGG